MILHSIRSLSVVFLHLLVASASAGEGGDFTSDLDARNEATTVAVPKGPTRIGDSNPIFISSNIASSDIKPFTSEDGKTNTYTLKHEHASFLTMHFSKFDLPPNCLMTLTDAFGDQSATLQGKGKLDLGTFWGRHIHGDTIELHLTCEGDNEHALFEIEEYASGYPQDEDYQLNEPDRRYLRSQPNINKEESLFLNAAHDQRDLSICKSDDRKNAICYKQSEPIIYNKARAVARLFINGMSVCTGWLVSESNILITNEHCIKSQSDVENTDFEFMGEEDICTRDGRALSYRGKIYDGVTLLKASGEWDYAVIQLSGNPAAEYGFLELDNRRAQIYEEIYIPQHPLGLPKEIAVLDSNHGGNCKVETYQNTRMLYTCDTEGGSSGSPVISRETNKVVALHRGGYRQCSSPNVGYPIYEFWDEISSLLPDSPSVQTHSDPSVTSESISYVVKSARFGTHLHMQVDGKVNMRKGIPTSDHEIELIPVGSDKYAIKAQVGGNDLYLRIPNGEAFVQAQAQGYVTDEEHFYIEDVGDGKVAFRSVKFGNYLRGSWDRVVDTQTYVAKWEKFVLEPIDRSNRPSGGTFIIKSPKFGTYLCLHENGKVDMRTVDKTNHDEIEIIALGDGKVAFKSVQVSDTYLRIASPGPLQEATTQTRLGVTVGQEEFYIESLGDGLVAIRSAKYDTYLRGNLNAVQPYTFFSRMDVDTQEYVAAWEKFVLRPISSLIQSGTYYIQSAEQDTRICIDANGVVEPRMAERMNDDEIEIIALGDMKYALKSKAHGEMYLSVTSQGSDQRVIALSSITEEGLFYIERLDDGRVAFRSVKFGNYFRGRRAGYVDTQTHVAGHWEQFVLIQSIETSDIHFESE